MTSISDCCGIHSSWALSLKLEKKFTSHLSMVWKLTNYLCQTGLLHRIKSKRVVAETCEAKINHIFSLLTTILVLTEEKWIGVHVRGCKVLLLHWKQVMFYEHLSIIILEIILTFIARLPYVRKHHPAWIFGAVYITWKPFLEVFKILQVMCTVHLKKTTWQIADWN